MLRISCIFIIGIAGWRAGGNDFLRQRRFFFRSEAFFLQSETYCSLLANESQVSRHKVTKKSWRISKKRRETKSTSIFFSKVLRSATKNQPRKAANPSLNQIPLLPSRKKQSGESRKKNPQLACPSRGG